MDEGKRLPEDDDAEENIERFLREKNEEKKETNNGVNLHLLN